MIETTRLILRPPEDRDRDALAALNADPRVGEWLSGVLTREESDALVDRVNAHIAEHGFGFWAVERKEDGAIIGMAATEAARAAVAWGFANTGAPEIIAITARENFRSQAVMLRIGMVAEPSRDFDHPRLADDHPLKAHVTWSLRRP
jgi:RimJ/RimL family protein N-acetyltransferase